MATILGKVAAFYGVTRISPDPHSRIFCPIDRLHEQVYMGHNLPIRAVESCCTSCSIFSASLLQCDKKSSVITLVVLLCLAALSEIILLGYTIFKLYEDSAQLVREKSCLKELEKRDSGLQANLKVMPELSSLGRRHLKTALEESVSLSQWRVARRVLHVATTLLLLVATAATIVALLYSIPWLILPLLIVGPIAVTAGVITLIWHHVFAPCKKLSLDSEEKIQACTFTLPPSYNVVMQEPARHPPARSDVALAPDYNAVVNNEPPRYEDLFPKRAEFQINHFAAPCGLQLPGAAAAYESQPRHNAFSQLHFQGEQMLHA